MNKKRVLDVGSGSGACAIAAALSGAHSVTANDIDPGMFIKCVLDVGSSKWSATV